MIPVLLIIPIAAFTIYSYGYSPLPGLSLDLKLYANQNGNLVDRTSILEKDNVIVVLLVEAVAPHNYPEDLPVVYKGAFKGKGLIYIPAKKLKPIAKAWVEYHRARGIEKLDKAYAGLILHILVVDRAQKKVLYHVLDSISYKPIDVLAGKSLKYSLQTSNSKRYWQGSKDS
ncbi:hypothetical protein [Hyperthermus butylicus]|uniref:Uncharacterized protein n=1 Tax=Hyperthermus butylicus (strain DSM 5456 / JCM 9403 / PLM1-5) TaxID=415426 RepID=A2BMG7_HYPBU|nr:hypothetical protein [Hyperthermus butylicus]ABM81178.1 hypothetical protein Hbut_1350 [Hyperthermus butylicus DSM 5456]